jgi:hypothetical protein
MKSDQLYPETTKEIYNKIVALAMDKMESIKPYETVIDNYLFESIG